VVGTAPVTFGGVVATLGARPAGHKLSDVVESRLDRGGNRALSTMRRATSGVGANFEPVLGVSFSAPGFGFSTSGLSAGVCSAQVDLGR
jgi:hypothetical protein